MEEVPAGVRSAVPLVGSARPPVTVGMPVYNGGRYLPSALESLTTQTFSDFELLIADNASTDETSSICRDLARRDQRVVYVRREKNYGALANFQFVAEQRPSEYFMWAAADDRWSEDCLSRLVGEMSSRPAVGLAFGPFEIIDLEDRVVEAKSFDYSGPSPRQRIARFCKEWNDACIYGLFRREYLRPEFPRWWGPNRHTPLNTAYPILVEVLSRSEFAFASGPPIWFQRQSGIRYERPLNSYRLAARSLEEVRRVNVAWECTRSAVRGSGSLWTGVASTPSIARHYLCDVLRRLR